MDGNFDVGFGVDLNVGLDVQAVQTGDEHGRERSEASAWACQRWVFLLCRLMG